eukprot:jgi/Hompol1/3983/HPOL_003424-RA
MSLLINWDLLKNSSEAASLKDFVNERFREVEKPSFIGNVTVVELEFGESCSAAASASIPVADADLVSIN